MKYLLLTLPLFFIIATANVNLTTGDSDQLVSFGDIQENGALSKTNNPFEETVSYKQTCFKSGENTTGQSKTCYYNCTCGTKALNKKAYQLCPLSAKFEC